MSVSKEYNFIRGFESDCQYFSEEIILRICKRAIRTMNRQKASLAGSTDDYPGNFTFFDILSIEIQNRDYDEINPHLQNFVENTLDLEYEKISELEHLVLQYSECSESLECDNQKVRMNIYNKFNDLLNEHYALKKIQRFLERF